MTEQVIAAFQQNLRGRLIQQGDADYDTARALYNGMIDKRPRLIAQCVDVADVITAVGFARDQGLLLAIRGGGHNGPGLGSCNDGLVIDLSMMKSVRVDAAAKTVRVEGGCTSGVVDHATHAYGLAVAREPRRGLEGFGRALALCVHPVAAWRLLSIPGRTLTLARYAAGGYVIGGLLLLMFV